MYKLELFTEERSPTTGGLVFRRHEIIRPAAELPDQWCGYVMEKFFPQSYEFRVHAKADINIDELVSFWLEHGPVGNR